MTLAELQFATQLASIPEPISVAKPEEDKIPVIVNLLVENDVPLEPLIRFRRIDYPELLQSPTFNEAHAEQMKKCSSWRKEFTSLNQELESRGIESILIKSSGFFPYTSGNLDILVRQKDFHVVDELLINRGYLQLKNCTEFNKNLYKTFYQGKEIFALHLHNSVGWESTFIGNDEAFMGHADSEFDPLVTTLSSENYVLTTLAQCIYENTCFRILDIAIIRRGLSEKLDWEYMREIVERFGWADGFYASLLVYEGLETILFKDSLIPPEIVNQATNYLRKNCAWLLTYLHRKFKKEIKLPFPISSNICKILIFKKLLTQPKSKPLKMRWQQTFSSAIKPYILLMLGMLLTKPFLITLSGPDGVGKTTLAQSLAELFYQCGVNSKIVWLRPASSPLWYSRLKQKLSFKRVTLKGKTVDVGSARKVIRRIAELVDLFMFLMVTGLWVRLKLFRRNVVLICDRYFYDAVVDMRVGGKRNWGIILRIMNVVCPKPGIKLLMYGASEELKKSLEYQQQSQYFKELAAKFDFWISSWSGNRNNETQPLANKIIDKYFDQCFPKRY